MKKITAFILTSVLFCAMFMVTSATEIVFVSSDGLDTNDGSFLTPFATLQKAVDTVSDGGVVYMREGTYNTGAALSKSITIKAYNNEKVVFSAAQKGTPMPISAEERKLIEESDAKPKVHYLEGIERIGEIRENGVSHALLIDGKYERPASFLDDEVMEVRFERLDKQPDGRYECIGSIASNDYTMKHHLEGYVTGTLGGKDFLSSYKLIPNIGDLQIKADFGSNQEHEGGKSRIVTAVGKIWFEYNVAFISKPGEWSAENGKVYLYPRKSAEEIEYLADYETYIAAENVNGIKISGIEFSKTLGNAIRLNNCDGAVISGCSFKNITDTAVFLEECENAEIFNCEFNDNAAKCIEFVKTNNSTIDNCGFENNAVLGREGIYYIDISGDSNALTKSELLTSPGGAVRLSGSKNAVTGCRIEDSSYFGSNAAIVVGDSSTDTVISENFISGNNKNDLKQKASLVMNPWGGIAGWKSVSKNEYPERILDDLKAGISINPASAIGISRLSSGTKIYRNVVEDCDEGVSLGDSDNNKVYNNVFYTELSYLSIGTDKDIFTEEEFVPENNNIHDNILCDQEDIVSDLYKSDGNVFENNVKTAHANALERDGRIKLDKIREKLPDFEDISMDDIGRYEVPEAVEDTAIMLLIGSDRVSARGVVSDIDTSAKIVDSRTLVPVRYISESFGETVGWDEATKTVSVGEKIKIVIGKSSMTVGMQEKALDVPAGIYDDRTFVPLRAIAEALGKSVFWDDRGLIVITDSPAEISYDKATGLIGLLS